MNESIFSSMRGQLRPSEAARVELWARLAETEKRKKEAPMKKYLAAAACAALLLCAYPAYNALHSGGPSRLHSYITVDAGDSGVVKAYRQESIDVGGRGELEEERNLGVLDDPVGEVPVQLGADAYQLLMAHFGENLPDWYGGAYIDGTGPLIVLLVEERDPGDKTLELEVLEAVGSLPVGFTGAKYSRNELERMNEALLRILEGTDIFASFGIYEDQNRIVLDVPEPLPEDILAAIGALDPEDDAILIRVVEVRPVVDELVKAPAPIESIGKTILPGGDTVEPEEGEGPLATQPAANAAVFDDEDLMAIEPQIEEFSEGDMTVSP